MWDGFVTAKKQQGEVFKDGCKGLRSYRDPGLGWPLGTEKFESIGFFKRKEETKEIERHTIRRLRKKGKAGGAGKERGGGEEGKEE